MSRRRLRVNDIIRQEIADLLSHQVKDPRLKCLMTVTEVVASADLRHAKVYISVLGGEEEKREALAGLERASGYLRRELGERLSLRYIPELVFQLDESIERGSHLLELMKKVASGPEQPADES